MTRPAGPAEDLKTVGTSAFGTFGPPRIALAHNDRLVLETLAWACGDNGINVVGQAVTWAELRSVCEEQNPTVVLLGDSLAGIVPSKVLAHLVRPRRRVIVISSDDSPSRSIEWLHDGAAGYLLYDTAPDDLAAGVMAVVAGTVVLSPRVANALAEEWHHLLQGRTRLGHRGRPTLTARESEVLAAMADGLATKAIGLRMGLALKTVENHKLRIFEKLGVRTHAEAVTVAIRFGVLDNSVPNDSLAQATSKG